MLFSYQKSFCDIAILEASSILSISMGASPHNPYSLWDFYIKEND